MSCNNEEEYFSDGITEEIINSLANIEGLHVTARTSSFAFKNMNVDVREIGRQLNVSLILEGSVRKSNNQIRITAQLIRTADGYHMWSCKWDRELNNIFILQDEIAGIIAGKINSNIKHEVPIKEKKIENTQALDYYLKGTFLQNRWDFSRSQEMVSCFEKAIELEPLFIKPYIALCNALTWMGATGQTDPVIANNIIDQYLAKAIVLDKNLADIYAIIAGKKYWMEWNIPEAISNVNKALQLRPSFADAILLKGMILATMGNIEESFDHLFQAERLNPFHTTANYCIGLIYRLTNEPDKSLEYIEKNIRLAPEWCAQYSLKLEILCMLKQFDKAWQLIVQIEQNPLPGLSITELKAVYYAFNGEKDKALRLAARLLEEINMNPVAMAPNYAYVVLIYLLLDDSERAVGLLSQCVKYRSAPVLFILIDSLWDNLRDHPSYLSAIGFLREAARADSHVGEVKKYRKTSLPKHIAGKLKTDLERIMLKERPYLDSSLNLSDLSEMINCSPNQLSQLLNENIGKNFYDYVNEYRLGYFCELTKDPKNKQFTFLSLAYESGFNSKSTFNSFFKKSTGLTPSDYLK
ncbi:MAG TPA: helix-turn-helix domain-containing protein [Bacteroidales bacterium]|nr:helix-turn-helix domain-containing protein [Bacteroidales bacterium]